MHKLFLHGVAGMSRATLAALCVLVLSFVSINAQARVIPDLYEVVEAVPSRTGVDRAAATQRGLQRIFVRVTGDAEIGANPLLADVLSQSQQFIQSYRYVSEDNQLYLRLSYDPQAVEAKVHELQLPMWPNNRPGTLVWLAVDTLAGGRGYLSEAENPELFSQIEAAAIARGLPLDFPQLDAIDQRAMPLGNLWAQDERTVDMAATRYRPDGNLMGRLLEVSGQRWRANWLLVHGGRTYAFDGSGDSLESLLQQGVDEAANVLAQRYAVRPGTNTAQGAVMVELSGVDSFEEYSRAQSYFRGLAQVSEARLLRVNNDRLYMALTTTVPIRNLQDALALNRSLRAESDEDPIDLTGYRAPLGSAENPLRYRWY